MLQAHITDATSLPPAELEAMPTVGLLLPTSSPLQSIIAGTLAPTFSTQSVQDSVAVLLKCESLISFQRPLPLDDWAKLKSLRFVQLLAVGTDGIPLDYLKARGVRVATIDGLNSTAVAEHTVMLILASLRNLPDAHEDVLSGHWQTERQAPSRLIELSGKTVGIVGLGRIGTKVAERLTAFGVRILYFDIAQKDHLSIAARVTTATFSELLRHADIISVHVPLTEQTKGLIGREEFAQMKPGAVVINTARGGIVDEEALLEALDANQVSRAALDVFEGEPAIREELRKRKDIILTPHRAGSSRENWASRLALAKENLAAFFSNGAIRGEVL